MTSTNRHSISSRRSSWVMPLHMRRRAKGQRTRGVSRGLEREFLRGIEAASERNFTADEARMLIELASAVALYLGRAGGRN
jgi:hypothetical protein